MSSRQHKCTKLVIAAKPGGLKEIIYCDKPASVKTPAGYRCATHAEEEHRNGKPRAA